MEISLSDQNHPYASLFEQFVIQTFPTSVSADKCALFEAVCNQLFATGKIRYGAMPNPESVVEIRRVVRQCMEQNKPIPILMPWGSEKPVVNKSIDIAELCAIKTLFSLQNRIANLYAPGIQLNIRIEDASGYHVFRHDPSAVNSTRQYTHDFCTLLQILESSKYGINPINETMLFKTEDYAKFVETHVDQFKQAVMESLHGVHGKATEAVADLGWQGGFDPKQTDYYLDRYRKLYPNLSKDEYFILVAEYFAGSLARRVLNGMGNEPSWGKDYLTITFAPAIPGVPSNLVSKRIQYRTIPENISSQHMAPWRAKGYLKVSDEKVRPALTSFNVDNQYIPSAFIFSNNGTAVKIDADYIIES